MCIGVLTRSAPLTATSESRRLRHSTRCRFNVSRQRDENGQPRVGQWVLVHVGFAMSVINEAEARDTLDALQNMFDVEPDVGALLYGEEK